MINQNYKPKIEESRNLLLSRSRRQLNPIGQTTAIQSLALAKIIHLIIGRLPNPNLNTLKQLKTMCYRFVWKQWPDKVERNILVQNYNKDSLRMIDLERCCMVMKVNWLKIILNFTNEYFELVKEICCLISTFSCLVIDHLI